VFDAQSRGRAPIARELVSEGESAAVPVFGVLIEYAIVVVAADAEAVGTIEEERLAPAHRVTLQLRAGLGLDAKLLARPAERAAFPDVGPTRGQPENIEVLFIDDDRADKARVGV